MEVLTRSGRETIRKFYIDNIEFMGEHPETLLKTLTFASEKGDKLEGALVGQQMHPEANKHLGHNLQLVNRPITGESSYTESDYTSSYAMSNQVRGFRNH